MSSNKVALITGANKGIGFETARQLGKLGITVLVGARNAERGNEAAAKLKEEGVDARFVLLDIDDLATHTAAAQFIETTFGKLDILINNAAISPEGEIGPKPTSETSLDIYRKTFETNVFNTIAVTQTLLPLIKKSEAGRIVNLSSILGSNTLHATPGSPIYDFKIPAYNISKTTLNAFTVHLAYELKDTPIKVNAAHPGWVKTDMGGDNAPMEIEDGAKTSVLLATLGADGATGTFTHNGETLPW